MGDSMSTIINATTTNGVVIQPDNSGSLVLQTNNGTTALTIDTSQNVSFAKGFTVGATAAPAFSAYVSSAQSLTGFAFTKLALNTEEFDTNNNFDSTTNYRFTPTVAGYYQINGQVSFNATVNAPQLVIYKNGSGFKNSSNPGTGNWSNISALIYMNGSTDYVELYGAHTTSGSQALIIGNSYNYFQASFVRSA